MPSSTNTNLERAIAYMEGVNAFDQGILREHNPYIDRNQELMRAWWNGWDSALEESKVHQAVQDEKRSNLAREEKNTWDPDTSRDEP